jgi:hypothetical protein
MSNKPHQRPHQKERQESRNIRLLIAILIITIFTLGMVLAASGHIPHGLRLP